MMVQVRIHLLDTTTGVDAWHIYEMEASRADDPDDPEGWFWTDGNASCDCERARCLYEAIGAPDPNLPCGDDRIMVIEAIVNGERRESWRDAPTAILTTNREPPLEHRND